MASDIIKELRSQLNAQLITSTTGHRYMPPATLRGLLPYEKVKIAVHELELSAHQRLGLTDKIHNHGLTTFAILIWIDKTKSVIKLRNAQCLDLCLPLTLTKAKEVASDIAELFVNEQWMFLPYKFSKDMADHHCLISPDSRILPFVSEIVMAEGGFSRVSKLEIPSSLQEFFPTSRETVFIVKKTLKQKSSTPSVRYETEIAILTTLGRLKHPNIILLLGSYSYGDEHSFLFPNLETNLELFFEQDRKAGEFQWPHTMLLALHGLASALENLHNLRLTEDENCLDFEAIGAHNDLRPANILVSDHTFVLADFGLGVQKSAEEKSKTLFKAGQGDYLAPECMNNSFSHQEVGRSIDVWAFGCLMTEVLVFMNGGITALQRFRTKRLEDYDDYCKQSTFYDSSKTLKISVQEVLTAYQSDTWGSSKEMLEIAFTALDPNPSERPSIADIRQSMTIPTLRAIYDAVNQNLGEYTNSTAKEGSLSMGLWFESERMRALSTIFSRNHQDKHFLQNTKTFKTFQDVLQTIFRLLRHQLDLQSDGSVTAHPVELARRKRVFEKEMEQHIDSLWAMLPPSYSRSAQAAWFGSMRLADLDSLNRIETFLQSHKRAYAAEVHARAAMTAILLKMQHNPANGAPGLLIPKRRLRPLKLDEEHEYGVLDSGAEAKHVLIEKMYYKPQSRSVSPEERTFVMQLRAQDFNISPKPAGLRVLRCLGFVSHGDEEGDGDGYSFLYDLPSSANKPARLPLLSLRQLLSGPDSNRHQPSLRTKFQLAHTLTLFFEEFYYAGCLHEIFNARNVLFTHDPRSTLSAEAWYDCHVVGFHKTRPVGQTWGTEGPAEASLTQEYEQHPDYRRRGRFLLEHDYYSLGLVLLQIAAWTPIQDIFAKVQGTTLEPEQFRDVLVRRYVPKLSSLVGDVYRGVVCMCLDGSLERKAEEDLADSAARDRRVFRAFCDMVAGPLEALASQHV